MSLRSTPLTYARDSERLFERLLDLPYPIWLDSGRPRASRGRFDIFSADPDRYYRLVDKELWCTPRGGVPGRVAGDPLVILAEDLAAMDTSPFRDLPCTGGALGYFGYGFGCQLEGLPPHRAAALALPDLAVGIYPWVVVVDHEREETWLVEQPGAMVPRKRLVAASPITPPAYAPRFQVTTRVQPDLAKADYAAAFARIKHYLHEGDCYQVNFTQRFSAAAHGDPWDAYCRLRALNPAPFSAYLSLPEGTVLSSSPERFLKLAQGHVETKPIKGTRRRVADAVADAALRADLANSPKDRAENVMIVDLLRNDLGKCCRVGSVTVPQLFAIESYATVHHLVSTVVGELAPGRSGLDLLRGAFPGGSITGAPKHRAMQIIDELEAERRSVYCGAIGYLSASGDIDLNIAIRTLVCTGGRMYCWAGGGIVLDSELEAEYQESLDKAAAMLEVFRCSEALNVGP